MINGVPCEKTPLVIPHMTATIWTSTRERMASE